VHSLLVRLKYVHTGFEGTDEGAGEPRGRDPSADDILLVELRDAP
jgi:hypothetical protein